MRGVITRTEILAHPVLITKLWGVRCYLRCLRAAFSKTSTTFLEVVSCHLE